MPGPAWLVLPTYNEAENLERVVRTALPVLADAASDGHRVLVVDDASPDGTGRIADGLAAELPAVDVLHRKGKEGLGRAYVAGFGHALAHGAGAVVQMDSDLSHDPHDIAALLRSLDAGADVALGSRYVSGGAVEDWSAVRRGVSRGGCWYARRVLGVPVRDMTGGFKAWRRQALEAIDVPSVRSQGYCFQIEMTYRAVLAGLRVDEVPITFRDRVAGESSMSTSIAAEAAFLVPRLRRAAKDVRSPAADQGSAATA